MAAFDAFCVLVQQLAQDWGIDAKAPVRECASRFSSGNEGEIMLRLSDDESVIVVGASMPLSRLCNVPVERHALQLFLLQRGHAARLASRVRYAWLEEGDRIALYCGIEASDATAASVIATLENLDTRFDALTEVMPMFHQVGQAVPLPHNMDFRRFV